MKVLLADDDRELVGIVSYVFLREGYKVVTAHDGATALQAFEAEAPDLVVLDLNMPKRSGLEVLRAIRKRAATPVLVLSVMTAEEHVVDALDSGADDYLEKPFRPRELRARVRALLRRSQERALGASRQELPLELGDTRLDPRIHEVVVAGRAVRLTPTEFALLSHLMRNHETVVGSSSLMVNVWGYDSDENDDVIRVAISRLRRKIEPDPSHPVHIVNVPGFGYRFQPQSPDSYP